MAGKRKQKKIQKQRIEEEKLPRYPLDRISRIPVRNLRCKDIRATNFMSIGTMEALKKRSMIPVLQGLIELDYTVEDVENRENINDNAQS